MKKKQLKAELKDTQKALRISNETIKMQVDRIEELKQKLKEYQRVLNKNTNTILKLDELVDSKDNEIKKLNEKLSIIKKMSININSMFGI